MIPPSALVQESLGDDAKVSQDVMKQAGLPVSTEDKAVSETEGVSETEQKNEE